MERLTSLFFGFLVGLTFMFLPMPDTTNDFLKILYGIFHYIGLTVVIVFGIVLLLKAIQNLINKQEKKDV